MLIDLHTHSIYSGRHAFVTPEQIVLRAKQVGLDAVALTDHNTCAGIGRAMRQAEKEGILVLPGIELSVKDGGRVRHIIGLGIWEERLPSSPPLEEAIDWIHDRGGVVIAPHPFQFFGVKFNVEGVDGIEVGNAWGDRLADRRARALAENYGKAQVCGSDAHTPEIVGYGITWLEGQLSLKGVLHAIRQRKTIVQQCRYVSFKEAFEMVNHYFPRGKGLIIKVVGAILYTLLVGRNLCGLSRDAFFTKRIVRSHDT